MTQISHHIFREYDVRGVVGQDLTAEVARDVARAFGSQVQVETRPHTDLFGLSSVIYLKRRISLLLTLERTSGDLPTEVRALTGVSYRF